MNMNGNGKQQPALSQYQSGPGQWGSYQVGDFSVGGMGQWQNFAGGPAIQTGVLGGQYDANQNGQGQATGQISFGSHPFYGTSSSGADNGGSSFAMQSSTPRGDNMLQQSASRGACNGGQGAKGGEKTWQMDGSRYIGQHVKRPVIDSSGNCVTADGTIVAWMPGGGTASDGFLESGMWKVQFDAGMYGEEDLQEYEVLQAIQDFAGVSGSMKGDAGQDDSDSGSKKRRKRKGENDMVVGLGQPIPQPAMHPGMMASMGVMPNMMMGMGMSMSDQGKQKSEPKAKKPVPPFLIWRHSHAQELRALLNTDKPTTKELSQIAAQKWAELPPEEQEIYKRQCEEMKVQYRGTERKTKDPNRPKQPVPPFLLWRHAHAQELRALLPTDKPNTRELSQIAAQKWASLTPEEQEVYRVQCEAMKQKYRENVRAYNKEQRENADAGLHCDVIASRVARASSLDGSKPKKKKAKNLADGAGGKGKFPVHIEPVDPWFCILIDDMWRAEKGFRLFEMASMVGNDGMCMAREWFVFAEAAPAGGYKLGKHKFISSGMDHCPLILPTAGWQQVTVTRGKSKGKEWVMVEMEKQVVTTAYKQLQVPAMYRTMPFGGEYGQPMADAIHQDPSAQRGRGRPRLDTSKKMGQLGQDGEMMKRKRGRPSKKPLEMGADLGEAMHSGVLEPQDMQQMQGQGQDMSRA